MEETTRRKQQPRWQGQAEESSYWKPEKQRERELGGTEGLDLTTSTCSDILPAAKPKALNSPVQDLQLGTPGPVGEHFSFKQHTEHHAS